MTSWRRTSTSFTPRFSSPSSSPPSCGMIAIYYGIIDQPDRVRKLHTPRRLSGWRRRLPWLVRRSGCQPVPHPQPGHRHPDPPRIKLSHRLGAGDIVLLGLVDDIRSVKPGSRSAARSSPHLPALSQDSAPTCSTDLSSSPSRSACTISSAAMSMSPTIVGTVSVHPGHLPRCRLLQRHQSHGRPRWPVRRRHRCHRRRFPVPRRHLATVGGSNASTPIRIVLALALLGAVLGFVPYNFNPASIFMGDAGSMFLGFACAA